MRGVRDRHDARGGMRWTRACCQTCSEYADWLKSRYPEAVARLRSGGLLRLARRGFLAS